MNNSPRRLRRGRQASTRRRRSGHGSLSFQSLLTFMLSAVGVGVALQRRHPIIPRSPTSATPETGLPLAAADPYSAIIAYSLFFCFSASLISVALSAHDECKRASWLLEVLGLHSILLTLASLLSAILPPSFWLLPYIPFAVFVVCSFFAPLKWLYLRVGEVGAFDLFIRRFALARETPTSPGLENV